MITKPAAYTPADVELSLRQMRAAWRLMCAPSPEYIFQTDAGTDYIFSGRPIPFFNIALLNQLRISAADLRRLGESACRWAADRNVPWLFVVTVDNLIPGYDPTEVLEGCGLAPIMPLTGMLAEHVAPASRHPVGLQCTPPSTDAACAAILNINSAAYGMDLSAGKDVIGSVAFWRDHFPMVGHLADQPVSCASVVMAEGYRYVAMVATDPSQLRRGFADTVMRTALENAARVHGECPSVLHATAAGQRVYEQMGYRPISQQITFAEKRFLPPAHAHSPA